ncbi:MAG: hypothetical protein LC115_09120 [Bacteroidia bacterium]|nr:hypothetical protein [Bacteroidia bacterium]
MADNQDSNRERDLVLAPNEYAFISDQTKGNINVYVGPYKTSLANTDKPVTFDSRTKRFNRCSLDESIQIFATAPEAWYVMLKNPASDAKQPKQGTSNSLPELNIGRKVNLPGPVSFALWPGQMARVIQGHQLRSNQYLLVRVYDEIEARKNWDSAVIKPQKSEGENKNPLGEVQDLSIGKLLIIKGMDVSFYIPPTGIEVVRDEYEQYVREAVTLERMEYCILLDEKGTKRYVRGPAVVFPDPTEEFITEDNSRKFKSIELSEISGLYIKIIAPYEESGKSYKEGDELFITGKDQMIYYPRPEHAVIKYGSQERHFAIAIPPGEGRYFMDRISGKISLMRGPCVFLPDPRQYVLVRRILDSRKVELWFPGNKEALEYNVKLKERQEKEQQEEIDTNNIQVAQQRQELVTENTPNALITSKKVRPSEKMVSDSYNRGSQYTPPRMITLDTKYDGAVTIRIYTGYAVLVVSPTGTRKVVQGPQTYLLEYDEILEAFELSTGTPKTDVSLFRSAYLRVLHNKVSDIVAAESADFCSVSITLSYRVNFEGESEKWFNVENYVKFLTDHMRSIIRNAVHKISIMEFYANGTNLLRDWILGVAVEGGKRTGRFFEENGMRIYDVEVLDIKLGDSSIEGLLIGQQHEVVKQKLALESENRRLEYVRETETVNRQVSQLQSETRKIAWQSDEEEVKKYLSLCLVRIESEVQQAEQKLQKRLTELSLEGKISQTQTDIRRSEQELEIALAKKELENKILQQQSEVEALVKKAQALSPDLIAALQAFGDRALAIKVAESMAPMAILGGKSVSDVFRNLLKGTALENAMTVMDYTQEQ